MEGINFITSAKIFFVIIIWFAIFYFFLRIAKKYLPTVIKQSSQKRNINKYYAILELSVWSVFLILVTNLLLHKSFIIGITFLIIILGLTAVFIFFYFRDYISGLIIRSENSIKEGDIIYTDDKTSCRIISLKQRGIEAQTDNGEIIFIPYRLIISDKIKIKHSETEKAKAFTFYLKYENCLGEKTELKDKLHRFLLELPWIKHYPQPEIIFESNQMIKIIVFPITSSYTYQIENITTEKFNCKEQETDETKN